MFPSEGSWMRPSDERERPGGSSRRRCFRYAVDQGGVGVAALETLGCGVPSVLADVPGLRDSQPHLPIAWYVSPQPVSIAAALEEIAELDEAAHRQWSQVVPSMVRQRFGVERHVAAYHGLYRTVASRRRR
jgi:glycosyltransferase involved in cell wall biosynthesis